MKLFRIALMIAVPALIAGTGCGGNDDPLLAQIGDHEIRVSDYHAAYEKIKPEDRPSLTTAEERGEFLKTLVNKELMKVAAYEAHPQPLRRHHTRLTRWIDGTLIGKVKEKLIRDKSVVTGEMKDRYYENMKEERRVKAMMIPDPDAAEYVAKKLRQGEDFSALARDHSTEWPGVTDEHGDLGWIEPGTFSYPMDIAVWAAELGDIVGPMNLPRGNYLAQVLGKRPREVFETREELDAILEERIMEKLYMGRTKFVQDSLVAAVETYYPAEGKALLMMKYYYEIPEDQRDNPYAKLDAQRVVPTFTEEEDSVIVIDFTGIPDWTAAYFKNKLTWYPHGIWPTGKDETELTDMMDIMVRDFLYLKAAEDLGLNDDAFKETVASKMEEMRINYFYFNDLRPEFEPDSLEILDYFEANRERYRAPESYKIGFFGSKDGELINDISKRWREGATYKELDELYRHISGEDLIRLGETEWLYDGQDPLRDEMVGPLKEGGVSEVAYRNDVAMVVKLISRRPSRLMSFGEIHEAVQEDADKEITDRKLKEFLEERRQLTKVTVNEKVLETLTFPEPETQEQAAVAG